ncbi:hypothetical protein ABZX72_35545 [Streptomyces cyaneofuscatus]|uniref:hypothetical protein n=1 Tax=Streptomyces cyaneofuscatus TaxID=66883 RepID=UPI0033BEAD41
MNLDSHRIDPTLTNSPLTLEQIQQAIAHHEAAHAVVAAVHGVRCTQVRVMRVERKAGTGWTGATSYAGGAIDAHGLAVVAAAGEHGELLHLQESGRLTEATREAARADHDRDTAIQAAAALGYTITLTGPAPADPEDGATWAEVSEDALSLVTEYWPAISALAAAIVASPELKVTGKQAADIINSHL